MDNHLKQLLFLLGRNIKEKNVVLCGFYFEEMLFYADLKENYLDFVLTK